MPEYRRWYREGGIYFFTVVTYRRRKLFSDESARRLLHEAIAQTRQQYPFENVDFALLPDHLHALWKLPADDCNFSRRWSIIKRRFSQSWSRHNSREVSQSESMKQQGYSGF